MTVILAETLVTFHKDTVGRKNWITGRDAANTRLAASEFISARRIETVFISVPPCPQFMIIELYLKECLPKLRRKTYEYWVKGGGGKHFSPSVPSKASLFYSNEEGIKCRLFLALV